MLISSTFTRKKTLGLSRRLNTLSDKRGVFGCPHSGRDCPVRWPDSKYRHCLHENWSLLKQVQMAYHQTLAPPTDE